VEEHGLIEHSARMAGVAPRTLREWRERGRVDAEEMRGGLSAELNDAIEAGREAFKARALGEIRKAGRTHWQAWAWTLERMFPDEFSLGGTRAAADAASERHEPATVIWLDGRDAEQVKRAEEIRANSRR